MIDRRIALAFLVLALIAPAPQGQDPPDVDEAAEARLDAPVTLHFSDETALNVVLDAIKKEAGKDLVIEVNHQALKKAGISGDFKVKIDVEGVPLKAALGQVVRQAKLIHQGLEGDGHRRHLPRSPLSKDLEAQMKADTTVFAPGFDEFWFRSIEVGVTEAQVHKLIGKPIRETKSRPQIDWYYGPRPMPG